MRTIIRNQHRYLAFTLIALFFSSAPTMSQSEDLPCPDAPQEEVVPPATLPQPSNPAAPCDESGDDGDDHADRDDDDHGDDDDGDFMPAPSVLDYLDEPTQPRPVRDTGIGDANRERRRNLGDQIDRMGNRVAIANQAPQYHSQVRRRDCEHVLVFRDYERLIRYRLEDVTYDVIPVQRSVTASSTREDTSTVTDGTEAGISAEFEGSLGPTKSSASASATHSTSNTGSSGNSIERTDATMQVIYQVRISARVTLWKEYRFRETWAWQGDCPNITEPLTSISYSVSGAEEETTILQIHDIVQSYLPSESPTLTREMAQQQALDRMKSTITRGTWGREHLPEPVGMPEPAIVNPR